MYPNIWYTQISYIQQVIVTVYTSSYPHFIVINYPRKSITIITRFLQIIRYNGDISCIYYDITDKLSPLQYFSYVITPRNDQKTHHQIIISDLQTLLLFQPFPPFDELCRCRRHQLVTTSCHKLVSKLVETNGISGGLAFFHPKSKLEVFQIHPNFQTSSLFYHMEVS